MIKSTLKPCCEDCMDIDITYDTVSARNVMEDRDGVVYVDIYCAHQHVCKRFAECKDLYEVRVKYANPETA